MAGNQDAKNSANSRMHNDVNDPPCAKEEVFRTESKLNDRKIWIIGSIITILFLIATVTGVLVAHFVFDAFHQHVSRHFNMTLSHTTDGIKVNNTARGKVNSGSAGNGHCSQHHDVCAHVGNAFLSASSSYNSGYSAHHGFHGECSSWSSARIYADTEADEWLELRLEKTASSDARVVSRRRQLSGKHAYRLRAASVGFESRKMATPHVGITSGLARAKDARGLRRS